MAEMAQNVQPYEIVAGPAEVYYAPVGTAFPSVTSGTVATTWTRVGYTEGGVNVGHPQTVVELRADQVTGPIKAIRSEEGLEITFSIASLTLENYALALNAATSATLPTDAVGERSVPLYRGGSLVETFALVVRNENISPYTNGPLQFEVPSVFEAGSPTAGFTKDDKAVLAVTLHALVDPNRSSDTEAFGRLRAKE